MNESNDWVCLICCELSPFKVFGKCNHPICMTCCAKLRDLCGQKYCAVCREDLEKVIGVFQFTTGTFEELQSKCKIPASKPGYKFEDQKLSAAFRDLFAMRCKMCKLDCKTIVNLEAHLKQQHTRFFCTICKDNLKIFVKDLPVYSKETLRTHKVKGDNNDTSMKGHPLCEFCHDRYLDNETLHLHLRKNHFWCHFCEGQAFYCAYKDLRLHFQQAHYLCDMGECFHEQITNVFRTDIDMQAHVTSRHLAELGKAQQRQVRHIQPGFTTTRAAGRSRGFHGRVLEDARPSSSTSYVLEAQITELGNWNEPNSSLRSANSRGAKPMLGNKNKAKPASEPNTSSTRAPASTASNSTQREPQKTKAGKSSEPRRESPRESPVTYRRDMTQGDSRRQEPKSRSTVPVGAARNTRPSSAPSRPDPVQPKKEVGRPPPAPSDEPDVGYPPVEEFPIDDDDEYHRRPKKTRKQDPFPALGGGKARDAAKNTIWGSGQPRSLQPAPLRQRQSRKQQKLEYSDEFDDEDFGWLGVNQARDRSRSNERGPRSQKQNKAAAVGNKAAPGSSHKFKSSDGPGSANATGANAKEISKGLRESSKSSKETSKSSKEASKSSKETSKSSKETSKSSKEPSKSSKETSKSSKKNSKDSKESNKSSKKSSKDSKENSTSSKESSEEEEEEEEGNRPPNNCCIPNNPWGDDDPEPPKVANKKGKQSALTKELTEIGKQQVKQKQHGLQKELSEIGKQTRLKEKENGVAKELSEISKQARLKGKENGLARELCELGKQLSITSIESEDAINREIGPPPPSVSEIFQQSIKRDQRNQRVPVGLPEPKAMKPMLSKTLHDYPTLGGEAVASTPEVFPSYGPPLAPGNICDKSDYPPLNPSKPNVSPPKPRPYNKGGKALDLKNEKSYPPLGPPPTAPPQPQNKFKPAPERHTPPSNPPLPSYAPMSLPTSSSPPPDIQAIFNTQSYANGRSSTPPGFSAPGMRTNEVPPGMSVRGAQNGRMNGGCNGPTSHQAPPGLNNPPGLNKVKPPGFDKPPGLAGPPPGLASVASFQDILDPDNTYLSNTPQKQFEYHTVEHAPGRNKALWRGIHDQLGTMLFDQFLMAVQAFRDSKMDTCSFIRICRKFICLDQFEEIFEELVVLLPNIALQRELYKGLGNPPNLIPCTVCSQVLKKAELFHHSQVHSFDIRTKYLATTYHNG